MTELVFLALQINKDRKMKMYKIIRFSRHADNSISQKVTKKNMTLLEAQRHCQDPETSSSTCSFKTTGQWFDGYTDQ